MSFNHGTFNRRPFIVRAFRENDNHLTSSQLEGQDVGGTYWRQELGAMRKLGYVLIEEACGDWYLEAMPGETDAGRAVDAVASSAAVTSEVDSSPSIEPVPLFEPEPAPARSPYDEDEAA